MKGVVEVRKIKREKLELSEGIPVSCELKRLSPKGKVAIWGRYGRNPRVYESDSDMESVAIVVAVEKENKLNASSSLPCLSSHTGTETRPVLPRRVAVGNLGQWAKAQFNKPILVSFMRVKGKDFIIGSLLGAYPMTPNTVEETALQNRIRRLEVEDSTFLLGAPYNLKEYCSEMSRIPKLTIEESQGKKENTSK
ncbi:hypothetical protein E5676_scaffold808G001330 [Cucumis melo var. makuwa]|uniref:Uncharacterized protein n=1 Tax=Cucumis melo var. makuwa TaxID=1194695 RepID=A0A5A7T7I5_CUCMM|nr:hypothetical protein E6C27_scaffold277G001580 [Cucumis melo var. makuwa]TYK02016.1 hypothetical protein E5676_scaffold808G001330 [Cucumis melo var. makuwa]